VAHFSQVRHLYKARRIIACNNRGQSLAEYIIVAIVIAVLAIFAIRYFGGSITGQFENVADTVSQLREDDPASTSTTKISPTTAEVSTSKTDVQDMSDVTEVDKTKPTGVIEQSTTNESLEAQIQRLRAEGVGSKDISPVEDIKMDWRTLLLIGSIIGALGFVVVLYFGRDKSKSKQKKQRKKAQKQTNEHGQALVEFLFVSITFLFVILGVIQLSMILNAYSLVRYSAYNAARAAIVHSGNQEKMEEAARISLLATFPHHGRADHVRGMMENYLASKVTDSIPFFTYYFEPITEVKILDNNNLPDGTIVTFDDPREGTRPIITVQVVHQYELVIPLVNRIVFYGYTVWRGWGQFKGKTLEQLTEETHTMRLPGGSFYDIEFRIPLVAHYTMRMQSDYEV
jgi:uncharacterized protein (UPF0333 family)